MTDPYTPPQEASDQAPPHDIHRGRPCPSCGSRDTGHGILSRRQHDLVNLLFFGWLYLPKIAFSRRTDTCRNCGETFSYKTVGSWIALLILILGLLILADYFLFRSQGT